MSIFRKLIARTIGFCYNISSLFAPTWTSKRLYQLFATPPKVNIRPKEEAFLSHAILDEYTLRDWGGILYHWGEINRPYVLMSYGWGYNAGRWRHYVPALLEAGYRVIAYDPPGHGNAQKGTLTIPKNAALLHCIINTFGPPKMVLAHSFGGGTTIEALSELPNLYHPERLVIMAAFSKASWIFRNFQYI
ncbi:MAG: alpha/beta hydrolase, partial [Bacteroidota bacterium]